MSNFAGKGSEKFADVQILSGKSLTEVIAKIAESLINH